MLIYCCESQMSERNTTGRKEHLRYFCYIQHWNPYYLAERMKQMILEFKSLTVMWKGQAKKLSYLNPVYRSFVVNQWSVLSCPCNSKSYAYIRFLKTWKLGTIARSKRTIEGIQPIVAYCFPFSIVVSQHYEKKTFFFLKSWSEVNA